MGFEMLRFRVDGSFTIVQITDVHWTNGEEVDQRSRGLIERVLDAEQPDLVALTGDLIEGDQCVEPGDALRQVVAPIEARGIPWALAFGNHDDEGALSRLELLQVAQESAGCLAERGPVDMTGVGNYVLRVGSARADALAAALYFLDSGGVNRLGVGDYAWLARDQIDWYARTARSLAGEYQQGLAEGGAAAALPALAFFHIPLPELDQVWLGGACRGEKNEAVCCPALNSGFFAALVEAGDVMGVFVGHDHVNDFEGGLCGVTLAYGRQSGYASYGRDGFSRGARVIRLREGERRFESWIRCDDGPGRVELRNGPRDSEHEAA
jgi:hypothetical protein